MWVILSLIQGQLSLQYSLTENYAYPILLALAEVAEQADAHDSKSCSLGSVGSIPTFGIGS